MSQNKKYFERLNNYMKDHPSLTRKEAVVSMKMDENYSYLIICPGCGMSASVITDACGRCGMIFNHTELA